MLSSETMTHHTDPAGIEETHCVFVSPGLTSEDGETLPPSICIDWKVDLSWAQALEVGARVLELAHQLTPATPADPDAVAVMRAAAEGAGTTLDELAERSGIAYRVEDLTSADLVRMTHRLFT